MIRLNDHIINKEIFEFTCFETGHAFQLQHQLNQTLQDDVEKTLNNVFDVWNENRETIRIDKLEIDLGEISFYRLSEHLTTKLGDQLTSKLQALKTANISSVIDRSVRFPMDEIELLEYIFTNGSLPWWTRPTPEFSFTEILRKMIVDHIVEAKTLLLKNKFNTHFLERVVLQAPLTLAVQWLMLMPEFSQQLEKVKNYLNDFWTSVSHRLDDETWKKYSLLLTIKLFSKNTTSYSEDEINTFLLKEIGNMYGQEQIFSLSDLHQTLFSKKFKTLCEEIIHVRNERIKNDRQNLPPISLSANDREEKIYIQNAGLALISLFLPTLFNELNLTERGKFIDRYSQQKALFMLHYICTGETTAPEYTLQLNKILTGIPLDEPIPSFAEISETEKHEAQTLLKDVILHWSVLKNSSIEGLQGTFLVRDGLLSFSQDRWLLQVDRKGCDILLESIPWSWQMTKLDWMEHYLQIEW